MDGEITNLTVRRSIIPAVGISKANGEYLKSILGSAEFGAVSAQQIRLNKAQLFDPEMAEFSSRGPVVGHGQVKPDVTAPGVNVLSATVAVGGVQTNTSFIMDPTRYASVSGTSMSSPAGRRRVRHVQVRADDAGPVLHDRPARVPRRGRRGEPVQLRVLQRARGRPRPRPARL